ncbi:MAG: DUF2889 domain-containing protein [Halieaceae bacterium]|nr:DUF2889 domain-containing protein [Halieaceae bacterium]
MPLPTSHDNEHIHTRSITIDVYKRPDGLMDVDGRIIDVKPFDHKMMDGFRKAGEPVHDLSLRISLDDSLTVKETVTCMDQGAHDLCPQAEPNFSKLIGLQIGPGWNKKVKSAMSPGLGCTHIIEMLAQMATGAIQACWARKPDEDFNLPPPAERQIEDDMLNACYPYRESSPWVKEHFPNNYIAVESVEDGLI